MGIGKLKVNVNEQRTVEFSANEFSDKTLDLTIPTKLSDLTQDIPYVKEGEIVLDGYVKEEEPEEKQEEVPEEPKQDESSDGSTDVEEDTHEHVWKMEYDPWYKYAKYDEN